MPFGLTNTPAVFQALVNNVLRDFLNWFVFVYIDDILIVSQSMEEYMVHVRQVLARLLENWLFSVPLLGLTGSHHLGWQSEGGPRKDQSRAGVTEPGESEGVATLSGVRQLLSQVCPGLQ